MAEQIAHGRFVRGFELHVGVLDVAHQQALAFQIGANALADRVDQLFQCLGRGAESRRNTGGSRSMRYTPSRNSMWK